MLTIPAGTRVPLSLKQAISTKTAKDGDPVYAETAFPFVVNERVVIPAGTYIQGKIERVQRGWARQGASRSADPLHLDDLSQRLYGDARRFGGEYARCGESDERFGRNDPEDSTPARRLRTRQGRSDRQPWERCYRRRSDHGRAEWSAGSARGLAQPPGWRLDVAQARSGREAGCGDFDRDGDSARSDRGCEPDFFATRGHCPQQRLRPAIVPLRVRRSTSLVRGYSFRERWTLLIILALGIDVFPQVFPDIVGHFEEYLDDLGIELAARPELDFLAGGLN